MRKTRARKLAEGLARLIKDVSDQMDKETIEDIAKRCYFRVRSTDHLQSGRIPRREAQRISQEAEDVTGIALVRFVEMTSRGKPRQEAIRRAVNWACRQWSLARRIDRLQQEAATENYRQNYASDVLEMIEE